jgi:diaminopimelate decarboxylase
MNTSNQNNEHITALTKRIGGPFYFYDLDGLENHLNQMLHGQDPSIKLWYACKANPLSAILKVMRNLNYSFDVASLGEFEHLLNMGISSDKILATGPAKSKEYITHLIQNNVGVIVVESPNQLKWINQVAIEQSKKVSVLLRLQLDWADGESVLGGNKITPFGLSSSDWKEINLAQYKNIKYLGFHIFQWGNILNLEQLSTIWERSILEAKELAQFFKLDLQVIDLGGGLGIDYSTIQRESSRELKFADIHNLLKEKKQLHNIAQIWMELGRFSVAHFGSYVTKIIDIKKVRGQNFIVTEGGINHSARVALTKEAFPARMLRESSKNTTNFKVHGPLCTALDFLGEFILPQDIEIGDHLVFEKAGAYGFTESMPYFLCHNSAAEAFIYKERVTVPRLGVDPHSWLK